MLDFVDKFCYKNFMGMFWDREKYFIDKAEAFRDAMETATSESERKKLIHNFEKVMKEKDFAEYVCQSATETPFDLLPLETVNKLFSSKEFKKELMTVSQDKLYDIIQEASQQGARKLSCTLFNDKFFNNKKFPYFYSNLTPECQKEYLKYSEKPKTIIPLETKEEIISRYNATKKDDKKFLEALLHESIYKEFTFDTQKAFIEKLGYEYTRDIAPRIKVNNLLQFANAKNKDFFLNLLNNPLAQEDITSQPTKTALKLAYHLSANLDLFSKYTEIRFNFLDNKPTKRFEDFAERFFLDHTENVLIEYNTIQRYANDCPEFKEQHKEDLMMLNNLFEATNKDYYFNEAYDFFLDLEKQHKLNPILKLKHEVKNLFNQELKDNLINLDNPQTFDEELEHDGVKIHKLDGKNFNMMVHTTGWFGEETADKAEFAKRITTFMKNNPYVMSMSLISEKNLGLWGGPERKLIFGYSSSIKPNKIESACVVDNLSVNIYEDNPGTKITSRGSTYLSLDTFKKGTKTYNELNYSVIPRELDYDHLIEKVYIKPIQKASFAEEIAEAIRNKNFTKLETSAECIAEKITKTVEAESTIFLSQNPETQKQIEDKISGIVKNFEKNYFEEKQEPPHQENKHEEILPQETEPIPEKEEETITFKPDFLVCYDKVLPVHIGVAKELGVDIVLINTQKYNQDFERPKITWDHYKNIEI